MGYLTGVNGASVNTIYEFGTPVGGFYPTGIPDGMGAYKLSNGNIRLLVNSEIRPTAGTTYSLQNGTSLKGARINFFEINPRTDSVISSGLAYTTAYDRMGNIVTSPSQINGGLATTDGYNRFCAANLVPANMFGAGTGFDRDLFLVGEESGTFATMQVLDTTTNTLYGAADLGYGGWESATVLNTGVANKVAVLLGDDFVDAPIYLYVGTKNAASTNVLEKNGLLGGQMYVWCADSGSSSSASLAAGSTTSGTWKALNVKDAAKAGASGYDAYGYKLATTLRAEAKAMGAFLGYRIEDVDVNPQKPTEIVFNTTGGQSTGTGAAAAGSGDYYGSTWILNTTFSSAGNPVSGALKHAYDGDAAGNQSQGIRSQDNLAWSANGYILINEDRSVEAGSDGGAAAWGSNEASIFRLDPVTGQAVRAAYINRTLPSGFTDSLSSTVGAWETSGIIDVSALYGNPAGVDFYTAVQAHGTTNGIISSQSLVEGGSIEHLRMPIQQQLSVGGVSFLNQWAWA